VNGERVPGRTVCVPAGRLVPWVRGFARRHAAVTASPFTGGFTLQSADGTVARVSVPSAAVPLAPWPQAVGEPVDGGDRQERNGDGEPRGPGPEALATAMADHLLAEREIALLVVRRGGYAVARLRGADVVVAKVGSRYVQGRTAAGGWSQKRFARRRDNQTSALVGTAVEKAVQVLLARTPPAEILVTGGDRGLVDRALSDPRVRVLAVLPRGPHLALGDPRAEVVRSVPGLLATVRIGVHEPTGSRADTSTRHRPLADRTRGSS
jgi:hypothetical protein